MRLESRGGDQSGNQDGDQDGNQEAEMSRLRNRRMLELAGRQHGVLTRRQLLGAGVTPGRVDGLVRGGGLRRLHAGVYILGDLRGPLEPERARSMAAVLACGPGALLSHWHALQLWSLGPEQPPTSPVHVRLPPGRAPARRPGIIAHASASLPRVDAAAVYGVPVTAPARTLCDVAALADSRMLERAVARAEREGLVTAREIDALADGLRGRPGGPLLRAVLAGAVGPALTRSPAEDRFLDLIRGTSLPEPGTNVQVLGFEVDCYFPEARLVVEIDGYATHGRRPAFRNDRRRDNLLLNNGIEVLRFTWDDIVSHPSNTLVTLTTAFVRRTMGSRE